MKWADDVRDVANLSLAGRKLEMGDFLDLDLAFQSLLLGGQRMSAFVADNALLSQVERKIQQIFRQRGGNWKWGES